MNSHHNQLFNTNARTGRLLLELNSVLLHSSLIVVVVGILLLESG